MSGIAGTPQKRRSAVSELLESPVKQPRRSIRLQLLAEEEPIKAVQQRSFAVSEESPVRPPRRSSRIQLLAAEEEPIKPVQQRRPAVSELLESPVKQPSKSSRLQLVPEEEVLTFIKPDEPIKAVVGKPLIGVAEDQTSPASEIAGGADSWAALCRTWAEKGKVKQSLIMSPRLRLFVVPGNKMLFDPRTCDPEYYKLQAVTWRAQQDGDENIKAMQSRLSAVGLIDAPRKAELLAFGKNMLRATGSSHADADRMFRALLAKVLDVRPDLTALTPVTTAEALVVLYRASHNTSRWKDLLAPERLNLHLAEVLLLEDQVLIRPQDIFEDIAKSIPQHLLGPLLGVQDVSYATMCSGTESPILAMQLFSAACAKLHGNALNFSHRFSCEIEPAKQGYIHRNFGVPILFRDIQELGQDEAHTAWHNKEQVPGADAAVAGTSCVDFSTLNNSRKSIDEGGESGDTFAGLLAWAQKHRPLIIVNENVMGAGAKNPWPRMVQSMEEVGYLARFLAFDTKNYYIPQTRMRRYMLAINIGCNGVLVHGSKRLTKDAAYKVLDDWQMMVMALERPYTATLDHFLYPDDDVIVSNARRQQDEQTQDNRKDLDWTRSLIRHRDIRALHGLGEGRPFTRWDECGTVSPPDDSDRLWWQMQPGRVRDVAEVCYLRCVSQGQDPRHKPMYINLSQNPERNDTSKQLPGLCPCLTPNEIPLITCRGGPIVAQERLKLQGLPVESLTFTRETQKDMSSLAGNAMSSTVVGSVLIAAWLALGKAGYRRPLAASCTPARFLKEEALATSVAKLMNCQTMQQQSTVDVARLCFEAAGSSRLCPSEAGNELQGGIAACQNCGHSASAAVRGTPCGAMNFTVPVRPRFCPEVFRQRLAQILPPRIIISGFSIEELEDAASVTMEPRLIAAWATACAAAAPNHGLVLQSVERCSYHWKATWRDPAAEGTQRGGARLEFLLGSTSAVAKAGSELREWRLFADPKRCASEALRPLLRRHFAACAVEASVSPLLQGHWSLRLPELCRQTLLLRGDALATSWERMLGLSFGSEMAVERKNAGLSANAWDIIDIQAPPHSGLSHISGVYKRSPECGAANGSLHVRQGNGEPMYFFREVDPVGLASSDFFVVARTHEKAPIGSQREHEVEFEAGWKPLPELGQQLNPRVMAPGCWKAFAKASLGLPTDEVMAAVCESSGFDAKMAMAEPKEVHILARLEVPVAPAAGVGAVWGEEWRDAAERGLEGAAGSLQWLRGAAQTSTEQFCQWQPLAAATVGARLADGQGAHDDVAPRFPTVQWVSDPKKKNALVPQEVMEEAAVFERARRLCPQPLSVLCRSVGAEKVAQGEVLIAARPAVVALQAAALLSNEVLAGTDRKSLQLDFRIIPAEAVVPPPPDELWLSLPPELEQKPLRGRYLRSTNPGLHEYVREACGSLRFQHSKHWRLTSNGQVVLESDGAQGAGVLPHQVAAWRFRGKVDHRIAVEARQRKTFSLHDNANDDDCEAVPKGWNAALPLWEIQRKSLGWLRRMERAEPYLQEACECFEVASLGLRIEARATMSTHGRRAVLADGVGFGKTAVVLARLCDREVVPKAGSFSSEGRLLAKATLVLVPAHLVGQWIAESEKFIDPSKLVLNRLEVGSAEEFLKLDVDTILQADLIVVSVDVLDNKKYLQRLSDFATGGARGIDTQKGRYQLAMYREAMQQLRGIGEATCQAKTQNQVSKLVLARQQSFQALRAAEGEKNITRKSMNVTRKRRRLEDDGRHVEWADEDMERDEEAPPLWTKAVAPRTLLELTGVPLEFFEFCRVVCDEVSFVDGHASIALSEGLRGRSHLCLTGTPGLESTRAVAQLARSVGVIIGPDEPPPEELGLQKKHKEGTAMEKFRDYLRAPDEGRYRRHTVLAEQWLQRFARHNEPRREHIKVESHLCWVVPTPLEQVLYSEKDRELRGLDAGAVCNLGRGAQGGSQREKRLRATLLNLSTAEEVRVFQASFVDEAEGAPSKVVAKVRAQRAKDLDDTLEELKAKTSDLAFRWKEWDQLSNDTAIKAAKSSKKTSKDGTAPPDVFQRFMEKVRGGNLHVDVELSSRIEKLLLGAEQAPRQNDALWAKDKKGSKKDGDEDDEDEDDEDKKGSQSTRDVKRLDKLDIQLKEGVNTQHGVSALVRECNSRQQALRFFDSIAEGLLQPQNVICCGATGKKLLAGSAVVLPCGHRGCDKAFFAKIKQEGRCAAEGCREQNLTAGDMLKVSDMASTGECQKHKESSVVEVSGSSPSGSKFACLLKEVQNVLGEEDTNRVLIFCQLPCLMQKLSEALRRAKVNLLQLQGSAAEMHEVQLAFEASRGRQPRVLLIMLDERCAGINLTAANHVFFAHPVLRSGQRCPADIEAQAVGRARRFGQDRVVHVWRFATKGTVEVRLEENNQMERRE